MLPLLGRVDGLLALVGTYENDAVLEVSRRVPVVVIGDHSVDPRFDQIHTDNRAGMAALTRHLIEVHAVRRPAFVAGPRESPDSRRRVLGFTDAVAEAGLDAPTRPALYGDFTRLGGRAAARAILEGWTTPGRRRVRERPDRAGRHGRAAHRRAAGAAGRRRDRIRRDP